MARTGSKVEPLVPAEIGRLHGRCITARGQNTDFRGRENPIRMGKGGGPNFEGSLYLPFLTDDDAGWLYRGSPHLRKRDSLKGTGSELPLLSLHPRKWRTRAPVLTGGPGAAPGGVASKNGWLYMRVQGGFISYT